MLDSGVVFMIWFGQTTGMPLRVVIYPYLSKYFHEIGEYSDRNIAGLGVIEYQFLQYFAENPPLSAYDVRSMYEK